MAFSWKEEQLTFLKVELDLEDCVMPIENRLGLVDTGPAPFISSMEWESSCILGSHIGAMEHQLEECIRNAREC